MLYDDISIWVSISENLINLENEPRDKDVSKMIENQKFFATSHPSLLENYWCLLSVTLLLLLGAVLLNNIGGCLLDVVVNNSRDNRLKKKDARRFLQVGSYGSIIHRYGWYL